MKKKKKKAVVGKITPVKKAFCPICKGMLLTSKELKHKFLEQYLYYCETCKIGYK